MAEASGAVWKARIGIALGILAVGYVMVAGRSTERKYPDRIPVRFWHRWQGDWEKQVWKIVDAYNASQTRYEVIPLSTPGTGSDAKFILGVIGGDPPDVMSIWNGAIPTMAANGFLTPLETMMTPEEKRHYFEDAYPAIRDSGMYKGRVYGITIGADLYALYVNVAAMKEVGADPDRFPETMEELEALSQQLTKVDSSGNYTRLGYVPGNLEYLAHTFGGGFFLGPDGKPQLHTPANRRALEEIVRQRKKLGFERVTRFYAGLNSAAGAAAWPFMTGELAITFDGQWRVEELRKFRPDLEYRILPVPPPREGGAPRGGNISGNFMIIPSSAKHKEGAWEFVKFWSGLDNPERSATFYNYGGWLPLSPRVANSPIYQAWLRENPQFQAFLDILSSENVRSKPTIANLQFLIDQVSRAEDRAIRGLLTPAQALDELERTFREESLKRKELGYVE